jgi:hypothetical protein
MKPMFKAPGTKCLNLNYCKLLSSFAFNVNLRRYNLFHAHLMHTELVSEDKREAVTFPPWIMREAGGGY